MMTHTHSIPDVQGSPDTRNIAINRVGIRDLRVPLVVREAGWEQSTVAKAELTVSLPPEQKGTHMSRFVALLQGGEALDLAGLAALHGKMLDMLDADAGSIELSFPFFVEKTAPVSGVKSLLDYDVCWTADGCRDDVSLTVEVVVPVTSLCPCSKEISDYGAHNQRSHVIISVLYDPDMPVDLQTLIDIAENSGSCPIWATLKRPDEKYVTERAYEHPKFVEDMVRDVALALNADARVLAYRVSSENFESIHTHSAYAVIEHDKRA